MHNALMLVDSKLKAKQVISFCNYKQFLRIGNQEIGENIE